MVFEEQMCSAELKSWHPATRELSPSSWSLESLSENTLKELKYKHSEVINTDIESVSSCGGSDDV